jgi:DNA invertase Pin-like site-specific DNA recombinase
LGRSLPHLIQTLEGVKERGIEFRSLTQQIDTTTPEGRLQYHIIAAFAEFERSVTVERIRAGLAAAKRRGSRLGRKHKLDYQQIKHAQTLIEAGESVTKIARTLKVARQTVYSGLQKHLSHSV